MLTDNRDRQFSYCITDIAAPKNFLKKTRRKRNTRMRAMQYAPARISDAPSPTLTFGDGARSSAIILKPRNDTRVELPRMIVTVGKEYFAAVNG